MFGLSSALASAMLKVVDALPVSYPEVAAGAAERLPIDPDIDLLSRRQEIDEVPDLIAAKVRRAVDQAPKLRTVDPIGLVTVRDQGYLLATVSGADRTYRLSRILAAEELDEAAERADRVDLDRVWQDRSTQFRGGGDEQVTVLVRVNPARRQLLVGTAVVVIAEELESEDLAAVGVDLPRRQTRRVGHLAAGTHAEVLTPEWLRSSVRDRAAELAGRYQERC